jgi:cathepsin D
VSRRRIPATRAKRTDIVKIVKASKPAQSLSAAIDEDTNDFTYMAEVFFGDSQQPLYMLMDTGSGDSWTMGESCTSDICKAHNVLGTKESSTFKATTDTFSFSYGTGSVSGLIASDTVSFAGMQVTLQFGSADITSPDFKNYPIDGILGLGRPKQSMIGAKGFLAQAYAKGLISKLQFGMNLQRNADGTMDGEINFGDLDTSKYKGNMNYVSCLSDQANWEINLDDMLVGGKSAGVSGYTAVIDSGSSYAYLPPDAATLLYKQVPGSFPTGEITQVPCDTTATIQFVFGGVDYAIDSRDWVGAKISGKDNMCESRILSLLAMPGPKQALIGDVFLKNVYAVFDEGGNRIGMLKSSPFTQ